ncbi:CCA tRNA nucleotidyltransferase [Rhodovibrionaceae bacterium A322]
MTAETLLPLQSWMTAPETQAVVAALTGQGQDVRFVGGCVRDALLGSPVHDLDIATPDVPDRVMSLLAAAEIKALPTGIKHGTITAVINHQPFEITTLREDVETDGRWATVAFTDSWARDAARRDLTINALSCRPDGRVFDYFDGLSDLKAGRVRFVGKAADRMAEDYLRVLRFFRFHARFAKGPVDPEALAAARESAPALLQLSGERVRSELLRLMVCADPLPTVEVMQTQGILRDLLPEARNLKALEKLLALRPDASALLRLAAWLEGSIETAQDLSERLRLSNEETRLLSDYLASPRLDPAALGEAGDQAALKLLFYRRGVDHGLDLLALQLARQTPPLDQQQSTDVWQQALSLSQGWQMPVFPVTGADLLAQGLTPGPEIGRMLRKLEDWWIAQDYQPDRLDCLARLSET